MPLYPVQKAIGGQQALLDEYLPNAERNIFGGKVTLRDMLDFVRGKTAEEQVAGFAGPAINPALPLAVGQIKGLYHGSPYKFNKFAQEKIGTGEGAQAFGYGHYLTESPEIAKKYAVEGMKGMNTEKGISQILEQRYPHISAEEIREIAWSIHQSLGYKNPKSHFLDRASRVLSEDAQNAMKVELENPDWLPKIYSTTVNKGKPSSADVFLEWDKSPDVKLLNKIDKEFGKDAVNMSWGNHTIAPSNQGAMYKNLARWLGSEQEASNWFAKQGITGIKYPSGTLSGIKGSQYSNYVIFNPEDITIEKIGGKAIKTKIDFGELVDEGLYTEYPEIKTALDKYIYDQNKNGISEALKLAKDTPYDFHMKSILKQEYPDGKIPITRIKGYAGGTGEGVGGYISVSTNPEWGRGKNTIKKVIDIDDVVLIGSTDEGELIIKRKALK